MSRTIDEQAPRTIEKTLTIEAPADAVWQALTDATELERWFPLQAKVEPGEGGKIWMAWGDYWEGTNNIEIWEPPRRLRTGWPVGNEAHGTPEGDAPTGNDGRMAQLTVDYHIEGEGGSTTLRLVHTGFGKGAEWDDWYEGTRRGWEYELECLRHYLENHHGSDRHVTWVRRNVPRTDAIAFNAVFGPDGLLTSGSVAGLDPGAPYSLTAFDGTRMSGRVLVNEAGAQFAGTIDGLNNACFRVESFAHGNEQEINVFIASWGVPGDQMRELGARWQKRLDGLHG